MLSESIDPGERLASVWRIEPYAALPSLAQTILRQSDRAFGRQPGHTTGRPTWVEIEFQAKRLEDVPWRPPLNRCP